VRHYPRDINAAISWVIVHSDAAKGDAAERLDASDGFTPRNAGRSLEDAISRELVGGDDDDDDDDMDCAPSIYSSLWGQHSGDSADENAVLHIHDPLWVKKENQLWSATVISLSSNTVTVEYESGGFFWWKKKETFSLGDPCLVLREPGLIPEFEGCVEISRANGGYIRAWKTGFNRPHFDM